VTGQFAVGVLAKQARLDVHAGKTKALRREPGYLLVRQARADRQRLKAPGFIHQLLETAPVARRNVDHPGQLIDGLLQVERLRRRDLQRIG